MNKPAHAEASAKRGRKNKMNQEIQKFYSWEEFLTDSQQLRSNIIDEFDCVVGISKGGIFLAGMMAQLFDTRKVYLVAYAGGGEGQEIIAEKNIHPDLQNKRILLVDDISDKGDTLIKAKADLAKLGNQVVTATLHVKPKTKFIPDYFVNQVTAWIVYPWELE